uniref:Uncharacterized protein n=1 Tax=Arundo donax TaxID=35708 RepID=A0A0A9CID5_ARUDO
MAEADLLRMSIVLALGAAAAGGLEALGLLLTFVGRDAVADIIVGVFVVGACTASVLGTMLLSRFFGVAVNAAPRPPAPGTELFARITLAVALAVLFFVTAEEIV